jgi:hypothetical protein
MKDYAALVARSLAVPSYGKVNELIDWFDGDLVALPLDKLTVLWVAFWTYLLAPIISDAEAEAREVWKKVAHDYNLQRKSLPVATDPHGQLAALFKEYNV